MPLPLLLIPAAIVAGVVGTGAAAYGAKKVYDANCTLEEVKNRHSRNQKKLELSQEVANTEMDKLGTLEMQILDSFEKFSFLFEQIHNKPAVFDISLDSFELPEFDLKEIKKVSIGAKVLLNGLGSAGLGVAGGFAAAGATTAAVTAIGTASTGVAISSLSGAAAVNATLAALGGGSLAVGGGGIALGTAVLGAATLGVGLLVGGIIFSITGSNLSDKADEAKAQMLKAEKQINDVCDYLSQLERTSKNYRKVVSDVNEIYKRNLDKLNTVVTECHHTNFETFSEEEVLILKNTIMLVQLLVKMCKVGLVLPSTDKYGLNSINTDEICDSSRLAAKCLRKIKNRNQELR